MRLTQKLVDGLAPPADRPNIVYWDDEQPGLGLRFQAGKRTWVVRCRVAGRQMQKTLPGNLALARVRREAAEIITAAARGVDLVQDGRAAAQERRRQERANQLAEKAKRTRRLAMLADQYIAHAEAELAPGTVREIRRYLRVHWAPLHEKVADELDRREIIATLENIAGTNGRTAANRAKSYLSMCLAWGVRRGLLATNPVAGVRSLAEERPRDRVLSEAELVAVWQATQDASDGSAIIRLLLLTGARRQEVGAMTWAEVDLGRAQWTLAAERCKNRRPHVVPLARQAVALLESRARVVGRVYVFGRGKGFSGWGKSLAGVHDESRTDGWTLHDLRRTAVTHMAELGVAPHVIEAVVNHVTGHKAGVAGVYNRAEYRAEKAAALQRWADWLEGLVDGTTEERDG